MADEEGVETIGPPVQHPVPIPWRRWWLRIWAAPCLLGAGVVGFVAYGMTRTVCGGSFETSAISTLRNIAGCQTRFQAAAFVDEDGDGVGEFGGFREMSGAVAPRGRADASRPILTQVFRNVQADGTVLRSGYRFRMFLLGKDGNALGELQRVGFDEGEIDPDASEARWICYAWPANYDADGCARTFVVSEAGDIMATDCPAYSGPNGPRPGAALLPGPVPAASGSSPCSGPPDVLDRLDAPLANGVPARDGSVWRQVN